MNKQEKIAELKRKIAELEAEPDEKIFSERLREVMQKRNMKQCKLADLTFITRQAISLYTTGRTMPSAIIAIRLADALNVDIHYLFGFTDKE